MKLNQSTLDAFVAEADRLGGPGAPECESFWAQLQYEPTLVMDQSLDPFSDAYAAQQLELHREISGRAFDQKANEQTALDIAAHAAAPNPYNHPDPSALALHIERLSRAIRLAKPKVGARLLDMGCGWGLSSEVFAYIGLNVTAVDINPSFVALVNERAARSSRSITATLGTFDDYTPTTPVDVILFYECLHHAVRPWTVLGRLVEWLNTDGSVVLAGEPINSLWWTSWGMRLDPLSVYCMRKFGWFESGWSLEFMRDVFARCGLSLTVVQDPDPSLGHFLIGKPMRKDITGEQFFQTTASEGSSSDGKWGVIAGNGWFDVNFPPKTSRARIHLHSFRPAPISLMMAVENNVLINQTVSAGLTVIDIERTSDRVRVIFDAEKWAPGEELGNNDTRHLSLHVESVSYR
ncbi:MAG: hypothetical protein DCF28_03805 [Alphaproteobacteria bacterium]|nr:MAG: hypothetical protein DCF28_03805 [Alphaproteobacteria bacterium]PZO40272.1 MAG: hypothetical protein DCE92_02600 [Alphaproteobacteria bacterium]